MAFGTPTPAELRDRAAAELEAAVPGSDARARRSVEGVLTRVFGQVGYDLHSHLSWLSRQVHVTTCDDEVLAERHASLWGIARKPADFAGGYVAVAGVAGASLPAGSELRRADDARYLVVADITLDGTGAGRGPVSAVVAGAAGNALIGTPLQPLSPVPGVRTPVAVADDGSGGGLTGGTDIEPVAALRGRVLSRIRTPPHGGAVHDYHAWALELPGVTRVWVLPLWQGPGTVGVCFVMDDKVGGPVPSAEEVAAVAAYLDPLRPVTARVTVFAPAADPLELTLAVSPDTVAVRQAVTGAVTDFLRREAIPGGVLYLSRLSAEISAAAGEVRHVLVSPAADVVSAPGHLAVPGPVTWTTYP